MTTLEPCPSVVCGVGGGVGSLVKVARHFCVQSLVLGAGNKAFPGHRILSDPRERHHRPPGLASIFQMETQAAELLELEVTGDFGLPSLTLFAGTTDLMPETQTHTCRAGHGT